MKRQDREDLCIAVADLAVGALRTIRAGDQETFRTFVGSIQATAAALLQDEEPAWLHPNVSKDATEAVA